MYAELLPHPALRSLVACYWAISGPRGAHRVLPDGCIDVVVLDGRAIVVGAMTRAFVAPAGETASFGVRFRPGEAARLLREAPRELTDEQAPLQEIWNDDASVIEDVVAERGAADDILAEAAPALDRILRARLAAHADAVDLRVRAAASVLDAGGTVREAASRVGLSERQLARRFADRVGVSPKLFARVMRLQRAQAAIANGASALGASIAAGYADQAHFTRDARELAGATPSVLVSETFKTEDAAAE